jgi:hypothetical protein
MSKVERLFGSSSLHLPRSPRLDMPNCLNTVCIKQLESNLIDIDSLLHAILSTLHSSSYTILFSTSPPTRYSSPPLFTEEDEPSEILHTELRRDLGNIQPAAFSAPVFAKYVFLNSSLFMGFFAVLPIFFLLYVALTALSSLEVTYFAFSKEMGPAAQKNLKG